MRILRNKAVSEFLREFNGELPDSAGVGEILLQCSRLIGSAVPELNKLSDEDGCSCSSAQFDPDGLDNSDLLQQKSRSAEGLNDDNNSESTKIAKKGHCCTNVDFADFDDEPVATTSDQTAAAEPLLLAVLENLWEQLHTGHWKDVSEKARKEYAVGCFLMAVICSEGGKCLDSLLWLDEAILLGHPVGGDLLTDIASSLHEHMMKTAPHPVCQRIATAKLSCAQPVSLAGLKSKKIPPISNVDGCELEKILSRDEPAYLKAMVDHWPALEKWSLQYIATQAAYRTVPIEIGSKYSDDGWGQRLMTIGVFMDTYFVENPPSIAYLAQHDLLNQLPPLAPDAPVPDAVALRDARFDVNMWLGSSGTVSPLHTDPRNNFFVQVFGKKQFLLARPSAGEQLYPLGGRMENTAKFDPESPDFESFPNSTEVEFLTCTLGPGDSLYLPAKWWHYVKALEPSCSVNFWFN